MQTSFCHAIHDCHSRHGEYLNIELSLSEILAVYFADTLYVSVAVTGE